MKKLLALFVVVLGFSAVSFAQPGFGTVSAIATASATIVTPISITKDVDLKFGNVAVNDQIGTVVLPVSGVRSRTGGVSLPAITGVVSAAEFIVTGTEDYLFTFTLPTSATTVTNATSQTMTVDNWTSNAGTALTGGSQIVKVGATLNVGANQAAGAYLSGTGFTVTVCYN